MPSMPNMGFGSESSFSQAMAARDLRSRQSGSGAIILISLDHGKVIRSTLIILSFLGQLDEAPSTQSTRSPRNTCNIASENLVLWVRRRSISTTSSNSPGHQAGVDNHGIDNFSDPLDTTSMGHCSSACTFFAFTVLHSHMAS
jgi:hypothetical protein